MHRQKVDLPSGPATIISMTKEEMTEFCTLFVETVTKNLPPPQIEGKTIEQVKTGLIEGMLEKKFLPFKKDYFDNAPEPLNRLWADYEIHTDGALFCLEGYENMVNEFANVDLATTLGGQALAEGKKSRVLFFGDVHDNFTPNLNKANRNYITRVQVFLVEEKGYYGQVYVTTCKKTGGFFEVLENVHPVKIDLDNKQFITIEKEHGEKRGFRFQDRLKCENIEKMIDFVVTKIVSEPDAILTPVDGMEQDQDVDDADWWKDKHDDPDWWKKGPNAEPNQQQPPPGMF